MFKTCAVFGSRGEISKTESQIFRAARSEVRRWEHVFNLDKSMGKLAILVLVGQVADRSMNPGEACGSNMAWLKGTSASAMRNIEVDV